ncbi:hypothetical protein [Spiroplasma endosymbiont of Seladonia tumulorum]|uniref:hypothetical protein n=1 Tax=Spiroplasma endosymbiont of Seladonia tumulorum TaxID=3066321 RepID=UPI0030D177A5
MLYGNLIILFIEKYQNLNTIQIKEKNEDWDPLKPYYIDLFLWVFETKEQDLLIDDQSEGKIERIFWNEDKGRNFKAVYRWNLEDTNVPNLIIDKTGNVKVNE